MTAVPGTDPARSDLDEVLSRASGDHLMTLLARTHRLTGRGQGDPGVLAAILDEIELRYGLDLSPAFLTHRDGV